MWERRRKTLEIEGVTLELVEMTSVQMAKMLDFQDESKAGFFMIASSIESPSVSVEEVEQFPNRIQMVLTQELMELNGIGSEKK
jgi:hypothetical protein